MSERIQEQKVKEVSVDDECLYIELLNGLCLTGPIRTSPIYRQSAQGEARPPRENFLPAMSI